MLDKKELRRLRRLSESHVKEGKAPFAKRKAKTPVIFVVPDLETGSGYHEVLYAKDGDLNRGKKRSFRNWDKAKEFGREKHKKMGGELIIHPY